MFLATTADQRFWKTEEPILFLGEWCKLYSQKAVWEKIPHEVLPYHWDDRQKFYRDYKYLQELYERILCDLSESLNKIHGEEHDVRYWRIIIGAWLFYFIQVFFDRYACIDLAIKSQKVGSTLIGRYNPAAWQPKDCAEFAYWSKLDGYNQFLYSWLIERMAGSVFAYVDISKEESWKSARATAVSKQGLARKVFERAFSFYEKHLPHRLNRIVLSSSYLSRKDVLRLQLSLGQWPSFNSPKITVGEFHFDKEMRERIVLSQEKNPYEKLLSAIIVQQIPLVYLEGYKEMKAKALSAYPQNPDVALTANDLLSNDAFKFWSAHCVEQKARLLGVQHGGLYGAGLCCAMEEHEIRSSDAFYTWGWRSDEFQNTKPLAAARLNFIRSVRSNANGTILSSLTAMPRYSYHLYSAPIGATGVSAYFDDQYRFVKTLVPQAQKLLIIRFFDEGNDGWDQKSRWMDRFPDLKYDDGMMDIRKRLRESRLFIGTYNATAYLETFAANFPTVLFWNPHHWEVRGSAKPYFEELKKVGILHDTPEAAAQKVNEVFADPLSWWRQPEIQGAKDRFCRQFADVSDEWLSQWSEELKQQAKAAHEEKDSSREIGDRGMGV